MQADWTICHKTVFCQMSVTVRVKLPMTIRFPGELYFDTSGILLLRANWTICHKTVFFQMSITVRVKFPITKRIPWGELYLDNSGILLLRANWTICHTTVFFQMSVTVRVKFPMMNGSSGGSNCGPTGQYAIRLCFLKRLSQLGLNFP